ncbi:Ankyrin-1 [Orbilia brochopaga]|nr:Ankyrin-1 [Drechslerella brochopaga]
MVFQTTRQSSVAPDPYDSGGWTTASEGDGDSSEGEEPRGDDATNEEPRGPSIDAPDQNPDADAQPTLDSGPDEVVAERPTLQKLLRQILHAGGVPPQQRNDSLSLFDTLIRHIWAQSVVGHWFKARENDCFFLRAPDGLHNPFLFTSLEAHLKSKEPDYQLATALLGYDNSTDQNQTEYLLASLCYELILADINGIEHGAASLLDDLDVAFKGFNYAWRETMLWILLQALLMEGPNKPRVLAISLPPDLTYPASQQCLAMLKRLVDFTKRNDRNIKVIVVLGFGHELGLDQPHSITIDLDDEETKKQLMADLEMRLNEVFESRPYFRLPEWNEEIRATIDRLIRQPLLAVSYLQALQSGAWISKAQLRELASSLVSPEHAVGAFLQRTPQLDRLFVSRALGFLKQANRPMTTTELAVALAVAQLPPDSSQLTDQLLLDIDRDIRQSLAGLVYIEDGAAWLLQQFWAYPKESMETTSSADNVNPTNPSTYDASWVQTGSPTEMDLAYVCLRYISIRSEQQPPFTEEWPLLDYAIRFWHVHYSRAYRAGAPDGRLRELIDQKPQVLRTWLTLQDTIEPWGLPTNGFKEAQSIASSVKAISTKFKLELPDAISVINLTARLMSVMEKDQTSATILSVWLLRKSDAAASTWPQEVQSDYNPSSLLEVFPYAPDPIFKLLLTNPEFIRSNATDILATAVQQGSEVIADHCLGELTLDGDSILPLPFGSCVRGGYTSIMKKLLAHWPTGDTSKHNNLGNTLLQQSIKYGHLDLLDLVLACQFEIDAFDEDDGLFIVCKTGCYEGVQRLIKSRPALVTRDRASKQNSPLHFTCSNNFFVTAESLISSGMSIREQDANNYLALHFAARHGYLDIVRLIVKTAGGKTTRTSASTEPEDTEESYSDFYLTRDGADLTALGESLNNGHEEILSLLLTKFAPEILETKPLMHAAAEHRQLGVLKRIMDFEPIKINLEQKNDWGWTPLHEACMTGAVDIVKELLARGADPWSLDGDKKRPIDRLNNAEEAKILEIAQLLLPSKPKDQELGPTLWDAANRGQAKVATMLLDAGADKNYKTDSNRSVLHTAAYNGHEEVVRVLLLRRVDLDLIDEYGDSAIKDAASWSYTNVIKLLLDAGALTRPPESSENTIADFQKSLLYWAAINNKVDTLRLLLANGERFPLEGDDCPLERLTREKMTPVLAVILEHQPEFQVSAVLADCFHIALRNDDIPTMTLLLDNKANPNVDSSRYFGTALHECAYFGNVRMARALLDRPQLFTVNEQIGPDHTPLIAAVARPYPAPSRARASKRRARRWLARQQRMVEFLLSRDADPTIPGGRHGTMLNTAAARGSPELIGYLLDKLCFEVSQVDNEGRSAVHLACMSWVYTEDKLGMFDAIAPVNDKAPWAADKHGRTPLHFASGVSRSQALSFLLSHDRFSKAINEPDNDGWTPLHWACRQWDAMIVQTLIENGAKVDMKTKKGWSPWDIAVLHRNSNSSFTDALGITLEEPCLFEEAVRTTASCDSCFVNVYGIRYKCEQCPDYDLCFKCHKLSSTLHDDCHTFIKTGEMVRVPPKDEAEANE